MTSARLVENRTLAGADRRRRQLLRQLLAFATIVVSPMSHATSTPGAAADAPRKSADADADTAIRAVLSAQAEAWNRGDIDRFMSGYWHDERLRFASGGTVSHGWQTTLDGYKARYPDRATMGTLSFTEIEIESTGPDAALAFGRWALARESDRPNGLFTLLFRRTADGWKITRDHTSSAR